MISCLKLIQLGERGNLLGANATVNSSISLEIPIEADAMQFYMELKKEMREKKDEGILAQITDFFRGKPDATK